MTIAIFTNAAPAKIISSINPTLRLGFVHCDALLFVVRHAGHGIRRHREKTCNRLLEGLGKEEDAPRNAARDSR